MNVTKYCMGCMRKLDWDGRCRYCNFDEETYPKDKSHLPLHTLLKNGEYLVGRVLGEGGFGITYIGLDTALLQRVAIKEFYPVSMAGRGSDENSAFVLPVHERNEADFQKGLQSFLKEGRALGQFGNLDGVVGVKTFFRENGTAYLVMEYVDGMRVKDYVKAFGVLEPETVFSMVKQVILDLQRIHEEHILHRDVSVDNLIIDQNGKLILIDFGSAKNLANATGRTETILCKQGYSALEQYSTDGKQGPWTDVYGLCASIYYMLTGLTPESATERVMDDQMKPLQAIMPQSMDESVMDAVWHGMAVDRKRRYQSMAELYQALYGEKITEAMPDQKQIREKKTIEYTHTVRENILSRTRMQQELVQASRKRERNRRRKTILICGLISALVLLCIGIWIWGSKGTLPDKRNPAVVDRLDTTKPIEAPGTTGAPELTGASESADTTGSEENPKGTAEAASSEKETEKTKKTKKAGQKTKATPQTTKNSGAKKKTEQSNTQGAVNTQKTTPQNTKKPAKASKKTPKPLELPDDSDESNIAGSLDSLP